MALTGLDIYKLLPKSNCGECGVPTCLAFAMKLAQKQTSLDKCPRVSEEAKAALEGAAQPPIRLVTIGAGEKKIELGNETVLFRHEETFHHPTAIAVGVSDQLEPDRRRERVKAIQALSFERVGQKIAVNLVAVENESGDREKFVQAVEQAAGECDLPLLLRAGSAETVAAALEKVADRKPLIGEATAESWEAFAALAKKHGCPLLVKGESLAETAELAEKAAKLGAQDLVLDSGARAPARALADQTCLRRAALKKKFRPLGYPSFARVQAEDPLEAILQASALVAKYAGLVQLDSVDPAHLLPLLTVRQNIYTDPQKPIQLEAGLYQIGAPDESSPVLVTTNFSLTYFTVEGDVETSKVPAWVVVVDTEGTSVLTAWASEKFTAESIAAELQKTAVAEKVKHRKVILPGYVAVLSGKLEEASGWKVIVGPRESSGIPSFLRSSWSA